MVSPDTVAKRLAKRKKIEDAVRKLVEDSTPEERCHHLILYEYLHASGIRITMIDAHIREMLAKLVPEGK
jgi:hypothetical protein